MSYQADPKNMKALTLSPEDLITMVNWYLATGQDLKLKKRIGECVKDHTIVVDLGDITTV